MMEKRLSLVEIVNNDEQSLNESALENALLVAGFVPVIGEIADIILIAKYLKEERYLEAGIMLIALIPTIGDVIAKPFLLLFKGVKGAKLSPKAIEILKNNPKLAAQYSKLVNNFDNPYIIKLTEQIKKFSKPLAAKMEASKAYNKAFAKYINIGEKNIIKRQFRSKAFEKFILKAGGSKAAKASKLRLWWKTVIGGNTDRRKLATKIILGSNVLKMLGIYNLQTLEQKLFNDDEAAKLAANPEFQNLFNQTTSEEDIDQIVNNSGGQNSAGSGLLKGGLNLEMIKYLAKFAI